MNDAITLIEDLYRYNDWANERVLDMCDELTNEQLDMPLELGFGSLRNTLFHILTAEEIWLERWQVVPWRPFPTDSMGLPPDDMRAQLKQISQARQQMMEFDRASDFDRVVNYKDSKKVEHSNALGDLLVHVANHSIYHRAQALHYLKRLGRTVPVGLDYSLYKLARPTLEQSPESVAALKKMGIEVATKPGRSVKWDRPRVERYFAYHDWANDQVMAALGDADDAMLDRDFQMGPGSIRKTLMHLLEVERWMWRNWTEESPARQPSDPMAVSAIREAWQPLRKQRNEFIGGLDPQSANRELSIAPGGIPLKMHLSDSLTQICCHGTHHRAQLVNMLRRSERPAVSIDFIEWVRKSQ
ncbi:MAG: DinB family protein [Aureliella sp.]